MSHEAGDTTDFRNVLKIMSERIRNVTVDTETETESYPFDWWAKNRIYQLEEEVGDLEEEVRGLQDKTLVLTGCIYFGEIVEDDEGCVHCLHENADRWEKCKDFSRQMAKYDQDPMSVECGYYLRKNDI